MTMAPITGVQPEYSTSFTYELRWETTHQTGIRSRNRHSTRGATHGRESAKKKKISNYASVEASVMDRIDATHIKLWKWQMWRPPEGIKLWGHPDWQQWAWPHYPDLFYTCERRPRPWSWCYLRKISREGVGELNKDGGTLKCLPRTKLANAAVRTLLEHKRMAWWMSNFPLGIHPSTIAAMDARKPTTMACACKMVHSKLNLTKHDWKPQGALTWVRAMFP